MFSKLTGTLLRTSANVSRKHEVIPLTFGDVDPNPPPSTKGIRRKDFRVIKFLGEGGCGTVTLAIHLRSGVHVALKTINCGASADHASIKSAFVEKEALLRLADIPQVLQLLGTGSDTKTLYIATEPHKGTYSQEIRTYGHLNVERAKYRFAEEVTSTASSCLLSRTYIYLLDHFD